MRTVGDILRRKAKQGTVMVGTKDTVLEAVRRMDAANTGSVVVLEGNRLAGIFTERDLMQRVVLKGLDIATTPVSDVMTRDLVYTEPSQPASEAMTKITQHRCRHLPVVDGDRLVGLVSIGDLMKEFSEEQTVEIEFLKEYIYSR
jgi:CBS domain-containing protein